MPLTAGATTAQDGPDTATHRGSYVDQSSPRADVRWNVEQLDRILTEQGDGDVLVGDMVFRRAVLQRHRDALAGATPTSSDGASASAGAGAAQWPGGIIYYTFDASVSAPHRAHFLDAGAEWGAFANVSFVARGTQAHYVTVKDVAGLTGGNSSIGMAGGQQFLNIGSGSWNRATLLHEIGHALGFVHEHQRSDRDTYVTILTANIAPGKEADFVVLPSSNFGAYDFLSVMHYARSTLSVDPATKDTIVPTTPYTAFLDVMGMNHDRPISTLDRSGLAAAYGPPPIAPSAVVTKTSDSGSGSLRAAISFAFDRSESAGAPSTTVTFAIPTTDPGFSGGVATIRPTAALPALGNRTVINGTSQTASMGNTNPNGPEVAINGVNIVAPEQYAAGLVLKGQSSAVNGLVINAFNSGGIHIIGTAAISNSVTGCYVGTTAAGNVASANTGSGVLVTGGARNNRIGGTMSGEGNLLSGNTNSGVLITGSGTNANTVLANIVGLNAAGNAAMPNGNRGVSIAGGARSNKVGGTATGARNVVSGNTGAGVIVADAGTNSNVVAGNFIGTDLAGTAARGNTGSGVDIFNGAKSNTVGGTEVGAGNVISGNTNGGVGISGSGTDKNLVRGNTVGLGSTGNAMPNNVGITIFASAKSNTVGGTVAGAGNVLAGNATQGVNISGAGTTLNLVQGNRVGTDAAGTGARPNGGAGVSIFSGAQSNTVGGTVTGAGNTLAGNNKQGLTISGAGTSSNKVQGNRVGLTAAGTAALANGWSGIQVFGGATGNTIGGTDAGARNYLSGNTNYGVAISDPGSNGNLIHGNTIGQTAGGVAVANGWGGVGLWGGAQSNQIGGAGAGMGNVIAGNSSHGVLILDTATTGNAIRGNAVTNNAGLGINLAGGSQNGAGVTTNDSGDGDGGANGLQNYPALTSAANGTTLVVQGTLSSTPNTTYRVELFSSPTPDPSAYGEGSSYLGFVTVTTGAGGTSPTFTFTAAITVASGFAITATATDPSGNTSEFSLRRLVS